MRLDAIERFEDRNSLELTDSHPIGLVAYENESDEIGLIDDVCKSDISPNIMYYDGKGNRAATMFGKNLVYKTSKTKSLFNKINELIRFTQATGLQVPALAVIDCIDNESLMDTKVQNDLMGIIRSCRLYPIKILFVQCEKEGSSTALFKEIMMSCDVGMLERRVVRKKNKQLVLEDKPNYVELTREHPAIHFDSMKEFSEVELLCNGRPCYEDAVKLRGIDQIKAALVDMFAPRPTNDCRVYIVYMDDESDGSIRLESLIRDGLQNNARFVLVGKCRDVHMRMMIDDATHLIQRRE